MEESFKISVKSLFLGDALGTAFDGLGKAHIKSHFKSIDSYIDPSPGLKGKMSKWKKPGLYSSISQFTLLSALCTSRRGIDINAFKDSVKVSPSIKENESGIFRFTDPVENSFIVSQKNIDNSHEIKTIPSARIIPMIGPIALSKLSLENILSQLITFIQCFSNNTSTITGSLFYYSMIHTLLHNETASQKDLIDFSIAQIEHTSQILDNKSHIIFDSGINPDNILDSLDIYTRTLKKLISHNSEQTIVDEMNLHLKTPITRATINNPMTIIPFALSLLSRSRDPKNILFESALEGGNSSSLTSIIAFLSVFLFGHDIIPHKLSENLINRKRIYSIIDSLSPTNKNTISIEEFIKFEHSLTSKFLEELQAKCKHEKPVNKKQKKSRTEKEREIATHVVESWTKIDKAKWKKERNKQKK